MGTGFLSGCGRIVPRMDREPGEAGDLVSLHVTVKVLRPQVSGCPALGDDRVCSPRPGGACSKG